MRCFREFFDIQDRKRRIGDRLAENELGIVLKCSLDLFIGRILINIDAFDAESLECKREKIDRTAVDIRGRDEAVARLADI